MKIESKRLILRSYKNEYVDECVIGLLKEKFIEWSGKNECND